MSKKRRKKNIQCSATVETPQVMPLKSTARCTPLSKKKAPVNSIHDVWHGSRKAPILRRSISPPGSGFDESWEVVGPDPVNPAEMDDDGNKNNIFKRLFSKKKPHRIVTTSFSSCDANSGYDSTPSTPIESPRNSGFITPKFTNLSIDPISKFNSQLGFQVENIETYNNMNYSLIKNACFIQNPDFTPTRDDLVELIDFCEDNLGVRHFFLFTNDESVVKSMKFIGFETVESDNLKIYGDGFREKNIYLKFSTENEEEDEDFI